MFEPKQQRLSTDGLASMVGALAQLDQRVSDESRVDQIRLLEELKSAAAAAQARVTASFAASQKAAQMDLGLSAERVGRGIAAQVALAKRDSPARARRYVGWSGVLVRELPQTFAALQAGRISEWRAQIVARETAWLSLPHRTAIDEELATHLAGWGDRQLEAETKRRAYRLDPRGYLQRTEQAAADRRVTLRPAPDTMSILTGLLPVGQGVSVFAALTTAAESARAAGDGRSRGQVMADTLVERVTGQATAADVSVEVELVITDRSLFNIGSSVSAGGSGEPAHVQGYGAIPADLARRLVLEAHQAWVRRLYTAPSSGHLVAMESRRRDFDDGLRQLLVLRDQVCRTPWCDAPIRDADHVVGFEEGGLTSEANGQGLCVACNQAKEAPGWSARAPEGAGTAVEIITPTGHRYFSRPPHPPGSADTDRSAGSVGAARARGPHAAA